MSATSTSTARQGLVDTIPTTIDIAIPRGNIRPALKAPCRLHQFQPRTFELSPAPSRRRVGRWRFAVAGPSRATHSRPNRRRGVKRNAV